VALEPRPLPDVRFEDGPSWKAVSRCDDTWRLATFNDQSTTRRLKIRCGQATPEISLWNPETGQVTGAPWTGVDGTLVIDVGAQRLVCLSIQNGPPALSSPLDPKWRADAAFANSPASIALADDWTLEIGGRAQIPVAVDRGWEVQGYANFSGTGVYRRRTNLPVLAEGLMWRLALPGLHETAELWIKGALVGLHIAGEACLALPVADREVEIELRVRNTAANRYYAGTPYWDGTPKPSGLTAAPYLLPVALEND
jgi:hypothetical protein